MDTPADRIAFSQGIIDYLNLGVYRGPKRGKYELPNAKFATPSWLIYNASYTYDPESPGSRQRIRVHQHTGMLGIYILGADEFRFREVPERDIRVAYNEKESPIMLSEFRENQRRKDAVKIAEKAEQKARDARAAARTAIEYADKLEREAIQAREFAKKVTGSP